MTGKWIIRIVAATVIVAFLPPAVTIAAEHAIAILSPPQPPVLEALQALAEAELSKEADIAVVDRQNLRRILQEHKLAVSGLADPWTAVQVGKLVGARMLVFLEPTLQTDGKATAGGCVIYDVKSGVRLIDRSLAGKTLEANTAEVRQAVLDAATKINAEKTDAVKIISIVAARNSDLSASATGTCESLAKLVERELVSAKGIALLERRRLATREQEAQLSDVDDKQAETADVLVDLEFRRGTDGQGVDAIALIRRGEGSESQRVQVHSAALDAALADDLAQQLLKEVQGGEIAQRTATDRLRESARFYQEAKIRESTRDFARAVEAAEASLMLDADNFEKGHLLTMLLVHHAHSEYLSLWLSGNPPGERVIVMQRLLERALSSIETQMERIDFHKPSLDIANNVFRFMSGPAELAPSLNPQLLNHTADGPGKVEASKLFGELTATLDRILNRLFERLDVVVERDANGVAVASANWGVSSIVFNVRSSEWFPFERRIWYYLKSLEWLERSRTKFGETRLNCQWRTSDPFLGIWRLNQWSDDDRIQLKKILERFAADDSVCIKLHAQAILADLHVDRAGVVPDRSQRLAAVVSNTLSEWDRLEEASSKQSPFRDNNVDFINGFLNKLVEINGRKQRLPMVKDVVAAMLRHRAFHNSMVGSLARDALETEDAAQRTEAYTLLVAAREVCSASDSVRSLNGSLSGVLNKLSEGIATLESKYPELAGDLASGPHFERKLLFKWGIEDPGFKGISDPFWDGESIWLLHFGGQKAKLRGKQSGMLFRIGLTQIDLASGKTESFGATDLDFDYQISGQPHPWITASAFSSERIVFAGHNQSLWEVDLASKQWREVPGFKELPSHKVTSLAIYNRTIYVGLDRGVLAALEPDKAPRIIVSSQRVERQTPLDNREAFQIPFLTSDPAHERLLFIAPGGVDPKNAAALWSLSFNDQRLQKVHQFTQPSHNYLGRWNGDGRLVISNLSAATAISADGTETLCVGSRPDLELPTRFRSARTTYEVRPNGVFLGSDLWWMDRWSGILSYFDSERGTTNNKVLEPTDEVKAPNGPLRRLYPLDGRRLLMSDGYRLWLLSISTD